MKYKIDKKNIDALIQPLKQDNPRLYEALKQELWIDVPDSGFVDRGDPEFPYPTQADFLLADLISDYTWRDLNFGNVVPTGATVILLRVVVSASSVGGTLAFRKNGNIYTGNAGKALIYNAGTGTQVDILVACDVNRKVEYRLDNITWTSIGIIVAGWWK